jgi:hypothetical protein
MKFTGKNRSTQGNTCPSATLSTTNLTWADPGSKPGLRSGLLCFLLESNILTWSPALLLPQDFSLQAILLHILGNKNLRSWYFVKWRNISTTFFKNYLNASRNAIRNIHVYTEHGNMRCIIALL